MTQIHDLNDLLNSQQGDRKGDRSWNNNAAEQLVQAGFPHVAEKIRHCRAPGQIVAFRACSKDHTHRVRPILYSCRLSFCPACSYTSARKLVRRHGETAFHQASSDKSKFRVSHLVLTTSFELGAPQHRQAYLRGFKAVKLTLAGAICRALRPQLSPAERHKARFSAKAHRVGYVVAADWGGEGNKLHFHLFYMGPALDLDHLRLLWNKHTEGLEQTVWIRHIKGSVEAIDQALSYVGKLTAFDPALTPALQTVLKNTRRVRSNGIFYAVSRRPRSTDQSCPECGAALTYRLAA